MIDFAKTDAAIDKWIEQHRTDIVRAAQELIRIPSVLGTAEPGAPFGVETRRALDYVLGLAQQYGFQTTKMVDGYAAHAESGSGEQLIGVLGHVDVVPAGNDWKHDPFGAQIEHGRIYGRGSADDKGPTISGFFGIVAMLRSGIVPKKRVRMIVGADEELGFRCMGYYLKHEEMPTLGIVPDGSFPVVHAEKGIANPVLTASIATDGAIVSLDGGTRGNMVPDRAVARLRIGTAQAIGAMSKLAGADRIIAHNDGGILTVNATGVSAHASTPTEGVNAVGVLCGVLLKLECLPDAERALLKSIHDAAVDTTGEILGVAGSDDVVGPLTSNLGVLTTVGAEVDLAFSVRYPVTWKGDDIREKIEVAASKIGLGLKSWHDGPPLHVPKDDPFLQTLLDVYRAETGDLQPPKTMGGGTYARVLKKAVAFGPDFPGFPPMAHQADEYWLIDDMLKAAKIYAKALSRLVVDN